VEIIINTVRTTQTFMIDQDTMVTHRHMNKAIVLRMMTNGTVVIYERNTREESSENNQADA